MYIANLYRRRGDGLIEIRVTSPNPDGPQRETIVGTSGHQGYKRRGAALRVIRHLLLSGPHEVYDANGDLIEPTAVEIAAYPVPKLLGILIGRPVRPYIGQVRRRSDGRYEWTVTSRNNKVVLTSHNQGYERAATALATLRILCHGGPHQVNDEVSDA